IKVFTPKGPEFHEVAFQSGLKVEGHSYRVESSKPKKRSIRQLPSSCRSRKATYLPYSIMRAPRVPRQDCWKAPNSVAWSDATRRAETVRRRSMSFRDAQLLRAIAASSAYDGQCRKESVAHARD